MRLERDTDVEEGDPNPRRPALTSGRSKALGKAMASCPRLLSSQPAFCPPEDRRRASAVRKAEAFAHAPPRGGTRGRTQDNCAVAEWVVLFEEHTRWYVVLLGSWCDPIPHHPCSSHAMEGFVRPRGYGSLLQASGAVVNGARDGPVGCRDDSGRGRPALLACPSLVPAFRIRACFPCTGLR